ncbi:MAG: hypothetical protein AMJ65_18065, partial [Phycisphaerae bacterium SG8_4]
MNATIERINEVGSAFVEFALPMLIQSGLLILILLSVDLLLRRKVRAVFRYWIWMLVLVKLLLPTSLSSPLSVGYWFGDELAYLDATPAPTSAPKVDVAPIPAAESQPVPDIRRAEASTRAPATVAVEPTAHPLEPAATEPIRPISLASPAATPLSWQAVALLVWLAVLVAMALLLLQRALFVKRLVAQASKANHPMTEVLAQCCDRMAVKQRIDLRISASATSPAVCGLSNPVILVPENLARAFSSGELRVVMLHELAHIKRGDLWVNLAATTLQIFYFYNPLLWLANAMIRRAREQAVDEMVLVEMGDNARQYPQTLLSVAKMAFKRPALSLRLTGVVESRSALTGRIKHILNRPMPKTAKLGIIGLAVVLAAAAVLLPMAAFMPGSPELVVKGTVKDALTGKPIAGARVFDDGYGPTPLWNQIRAGERSEWGAITNAAGEYSFLTWPEHHSISAQALGYKPERGSLYDNHFTVNENDEEAMNFLLVPDAVSGPPSVWSEMSQSDLGGRIVDAAGSPVADAQVALCTDKIGAKMSHGKLEPIRSEVGSSIVRTDDEGKFTLGRRPADSFILIVADDRGFALVRADEYADSREIRLQEWGRIEGQVARGRAAEGDKIWMSSLPNSTWFRHKREYSYETECGAEGHFVFEKVPAGWFEVGYLIRTGDSGWSITSRTPVEVEEGETAEITLGGSGRPVVGRFVTPAGYDKSIYFGNGLRALSRTRPDEPRPDDYDRMTKREQQQWRTQWRKTDQYRQYSDAYWHNPNWRHYTFRISDDGSFRIEDVIGGKYDLTVWIEERLTGRGRPEEIAGYYGSIEVPEMPGGRSDEPLDLGELELSMHEPLRIGDVAPVFEARTLDDKDLKLIDYRGKYVLLSFWQPVSDPEFERLKILAAGYNAAGRLEVIGLGGNDTLEEVKRYVDENDIPWPQIFTGQEFRSGIAEDYRIP